MTHHLIWEVDDWVEEIAMTPVERFYPTAVAKSVELPLRDIFERLQHLARDGVLSLKWEVRCPEYGCFTTVAVFTELPELGQTITCDKCGAEIEIELSVVCPVFEVNQAYRDRLVGKKKDRVRISLRR